MRSNEELNAEALEHSQAAVPLWLIKHWVDKGPEMDYDCWHSTCECGVEVRDVVVNCDKVDPDWSAWEDPDNHGENCTWAVAKRVLDHQLRH